MTKEEAKEIRDFTLQSYESDFEASKTYVPKPEDWLSSRWTGFKSPRQHSRIRPTGVDLDVLRFIGKKAGEVPEGFKLHRQMNKIFKARQKMAEEGTEIDWGLAEAMAFGSLLLEGNHVRLTGQDVQRGTFSHRHAVVKDQDTEEGKSLKEFSIMFLNTLKHSHNTFRSRIHASQLVGKNPKNVGTR